MKQQNLVTGKTCQTSALTDQLVGVEWLGENGAWGELDLRELMTHPTKILGMELN